MPASRRAFLGSLIGAAALHGGAQFQPSATLTLLEWLITADETDQIAPKWLL
jgi:hypothetical protein